MGRLHMSSQAASDRTFSNTIMDQPQRILVHRTGSLGDTLVALPAMWAIKEQFPSVPMTLLCDHQVRGKYVLATDLLGSAGIFDAFMSYPAAVNRADKWRTAAGILRLIWQIHRRKFDTLVYLAPSERRAAQVQRDRKFFARAGIRRCLGMERFSPFPARTAGNPVATVPHEADLLLDRLAEDGIAVPKPGRGRLDLGLAQADQQAVDEWLKGQPADGNRPWVGIGPGCKQPVNQWPAKRYAELGQALLDQFDFWPVIFGGPGDQAMAGELIERWGRGANAAGQLSARQGIVALGRCLMFVGNDTGTIHMAATGGVRCVGIYSGKDPRGQWEPYGVGHVVLKSLLECPGCRGGNCVETGSRCIRSITVDQVVAACSRILGEASACKGHGS